MVRSLWSAATGMIAQQTNVDTISNNLANVNTIGYKKETAEFKSLLYQTIQAKTTSANEITLANDFNTSSKVRVLFAKGKYTNSYDSDKRA